MVSNIKKEHNSGYAILFALIVVAVLLVVSVTVSRVSFQELRISGVSQEAQKALNAANSGAECAIFWDRRESSAFGQDDINYIDCYGNQSSISSEGDVYEFTVNFDGDRCAIVEVDKTENKGDDITVIKSRGYNICPDGDKDPNRIERAVEIEYEFSVEEEISKADISLVLDVSGSMDFFGGIDEQGFTLTRMDLMKTALLNFIIDVREFTSDDGFMFGITEFSTHSSVLTEITSDIYFLMDKIRGLNAGGRTNIDGGLLIGSDIITGNPTEDLIANGGDPIGGGRGLEEGQKFIILVTDGRANRGAIKSGEDRGQEDSGLSGTEASEEEAADSAQKIRDEEGIIIITFGVGPEDEINNDWLRDDIASSEAQWEGCGRFPEDKCHFQVDNFEDFQDVFNFETIFGVSPIKWKPI